jgi:aminopeptidase N
VRHLIGLLAALLLSGYASSSILAGSEEGFRIPTAEERAQHRKHEQRHSPNETSTQTNPLLEGASIGVDALHYTLDLTFNAQQKTVSGDVTGQFESLSAGLTTLVLNLYDNMAVSQVELGGSPLAFTHTGNLLTITLDRPYAVSEIFDVTVSYSGSPVNTGFGSFSWAKHQGNDIIASLSEPEFGPTWWPSVDDPGDKVTADIIFTVKSGLVAVSAGVLLSATSAPGNNTRYHWQTTYPIAPYLISIAASNYVTFSHAYTPQAGGSPMDITYWVYPELLTNAQVSFSNTPNMMNVYAAMFGEYPFLNEKYGMALFPFSGGMEHQTATSYGANLVTGTNSFDWIIAHELAHQWWGDSLTLGDWREIWLHEGFATHAEALYFEAINGSAAYHSYMSSLDNGGFSGPLFDNPSMFGTTVYDKGAWVAHMLRGVIGDTAFFNMLPAYHTLHKYGTVGTDDLRAAAESEYGSDLSWFFTPWVHGTGRPTYEWGWSVAQAGIGYVAWVHIEQTQGGTQFSMPLSLDVTSAAGTTRTTVFADASNTDFAIGPLLELPTSIALDPQNWVLNNESIVSLPDGDGDGVPDSADNCQGLMNPVQADLDSDGVGDDCDPDIDGDTVINGIDCAPLNSGVFASPGDVAALSIDISNLTWTSLAAQAGAGTGYDLIRGHAANLTVDGDVSGAACESSAIGGLSLAHGADPAPGAVDYFLIRGINACDTGGYGLDSSAAPRVNASCP